MSEDLLAFCSKLITSLSFKRFGFCQSDLMKKREQFDRLIDSRLLFEGRAP